MVRNKGNLRGWGIVFITVISLLVISYALSKFGRENKLKQRAKLINGNYQLAIGELEKMYILDHGKYIKYKYSVRGEVYSRTLYSPNVFNRYNNSDLKNIRFCVIFQKDDPGNSLINTSVELNEGELPNSLQEIPFMESLPDSVILGFFH